MVVFVFAVPVYFATKCQSILLLACPDASTLYIAQAEEKAQILLSIFLI